MSISIIEALDDPKLFEPLLRGGKTWVAWRIFLKAVFALPMKPAELEFFGQYTGRGEAPKKQMEEAFAIVGRRGGKSYIAAIIACFLALFRDWRPYLSPGEVAWIVVVATDRAQAQNLLRYIKGILSSQAMFKRVIEGDYAWEINLNNGVGIRVSTCNFRTLRGYTVVAAILDELAFYRVEGANPAQEILTALRPSLATVPGSLLLGISSPYAKTGPLYEAFRDKYGREDETTIVWRAPTKAMNPTIKEAVIDRALREDYASGKTEWLAEFREDLETYLSTEMIEAVVVPRRYELPPGQHVSYVAFVDPSGGRRDSFTLAIAHRETNLDGSSRAVLDRVEETPAPCKPQDVVRKYAEILKQYGVFRVRGDKYAGEFVSAAFQECAITYESSPLSKSEIYMEFEPLVAQGAVELLDNKKLFSQLRGLERRTRSGGKDLIDHYAGGSDDLANAAAGAIVNVGSGVGIGFEVHEPDDDGDGPGDVADDINLPRCLRRFSRELQMMRNR